MATRVLVYNVTCPAGTQPSAPQETSVQFDSGRLESVQVIIPTGHAGLTGIAIATSHGQAMPENGTQYLSGDGEREWWPVIDHFENGDWTALTWNIDHLAHTWQLRFKVFTEGPGKRPARPDPIALHHIQRHAARSH